MAIYNANGTKIGMYVYDAWGTCTVVHTTTSTSLEKSILSTYNPFRYRGYYYDVETGFYYLQSRYYNPSWGRFLNADGYINANGDIIGYNIFCYCGNNPIMGYDPTGSINWDYLREFGENCVKVAVATICITGAAITVGAAVAGTVMSGGAGAVAIPAAMALAAECVVVATGVIATVGVVSCITADVGSSVSNMIGENGQQTPSLTTWNGKGGTERLDVENPAPGNRSGQIHYHDAQNERYMFDFATKQFKNPTNRLKQLLSDKNFLRGLEKAYRILGETW